MKNFKRIATIVVISAVVVGLYSAIARSHITTVTPVEAEAPRIDEYENGVEQVMSREEFKKQQALLAKEIYLKEEKTRIQAEYDAKLKKIESDLEAVRSEKISF